MTTVEECVVISLREFVKNGLLNTSASFVWNQGEALHLIYNLVRISHTDIRVRLSYTTQPAGREAHRVVQEVPLTATTSPVGGIHWWFTCPLANDGKPCGRRVDKLYLPPGGSYFGCRQCHQLTYRTCQESHGLDSLVRGLGMTPAEQKQVVRFFERKTGHFL